jgi:hypothetical protein
MNPFKTEKEAVDGLEPNFEQAWSEFVKTYEMDDTLELESWKKTFRHGYMSGVKFITGAIINQMISNPPKEPPK